MIIDSREFRDLSLKMSEEGYLLIFGEFNEILEEIVVESILRMRKARNKEATLLINSGGGFNGTFSTIKSAMIESGIIFTALVMGRAASNAFNVVQICHKRRAVQDAFLMFHWGSQRINNSELAAMISGQTWPVENAIQAEMQNAAAVSRRTGISIDTLKEYALYERWFSAKQALEQNFIDEIVDDLPGGLAGKLVI